ncbi:MAG: hypothetical protein K0S58_2809 [Nitrospira sp.]|nr:hypothetical protein [Nitrospira sp.]
MTGINASLPHRALRLILEHLARFPLLTLIIEHGTPPFLLPIEHYELAPALAAAPRSPFFLPTLVRFFRPAFLKS